MTAVPTNFARTTVAASLTTLYTVASSTSIVVTNILLANNSSVDHSVYLTFGGVVVLPTVAVKANTVTAFDLKQLLVAGETIQAAADTASVINCHISGVRLS